MPTSPRAAADEDRVRLIAHTLWIEEGMPEGRAETHWFKAVELVNAEAAETPEPVAEKTRRKAPAAAAAKKAAPRKRS